MASKTATDKLASNYLRYRKKYPELEFLQPKRTNSGREIASLLAKYSATSITLPPPSHRRFVGRFVTVVKRFFFHIVKVLLTPVVEKQTFHNQIVLALAEEFGNLESRVQELEAKLESKEKEQSSARVDEVFHENRCH